jgi:hypothetical protein
MAGAVDLACVMHVHSTCSDGSGTVPEIAAAAAASGVDVVLLTDHDTLAARDQEGWHHGVLVLVGVELSSAAGHLLAFGIDEVIAHDGVGAAELAQRVAAAGGICFAAHPFSEGSRMARAIGKPHPWTDFAGPLTGIELWSLETDELEAARTPAALLRFLRAPERAAGPPPAHLKRWDELDAQRPLVGIGGLDSHQKGVRIAGRVLGIPRYERVFATLRTHVLADAPLSGDLDRDRGLIYGALSAGRCYVALDALAPARGFAFWADGDGLHARVPGPAELVLLRDGSEVARVHDIALDHRADAGAFRVEARLDGKTWIVSNHVRLP